MNRVVNISLLSFGIIMLAAVPPLGVLLIFLSAASTQRNAFIAHQRRRAALERQYAARQNRRRQAIRSLI